MSTRVLFLGTGSFAVPILAKLLEMDEFEVVGIVTQPDKPVGRKQELQGGPVKQWWTQNQSPEIQLFQPEKLKAEAATILDACRPDIVIVAAYGQMIPDNMLNQPRFKALNIHGSLLPQLRGAVPVQTAILQGLETTGVTVQQMVAQLDAGPILATREAQITPQDTTATLMARLAEEGSDLLAQVLPQWAAGQITPTPQEDTQATYCYQSEIAKDKAEINFATPAAQAERMVRAFYPWPVAWVQLELKGETRRLKIFSAHIQPATTTNSQLGLAKEGKSLCLQLQDGQLVLDEIQLEGKNRGPGSSYLYLLD